MEIVDLLSPEAVLPAVKASGKKQLLQELAHQAARFTEIPDRRIFETLIERERLGAERVDDRVFAEAGTAKNAAERDPFGHRAGNGGWLAEAGG